MTGSAGSGPGYGTRRGARRRGGLGWLGAAAVAVVAAVVVLGPRVYAVDSPSMAPALLPGDRLLTLRVGTEDVRRGDVLVVDAAGTWERPDATGARYVKRAVGLPGERVACCDAAGRVTVDGVPLEEPYLPPGERPSRDEFDVRVPEGRIWLMGDSRSRSSDSRDHLGSPGGGSVALADVRGRVAAVVWPPGRVGAVQGGESG